MKQLNRKEVLGWSKEEFLEKTGYPEEVYHAFRNSKSGIITIQKVSPNEDKPWRGYTEAFGEGLSCYLSDRDEWYVTSIIQNIDWNKKEFTTLNSVYKFDFKESKDE